jgi:hypothetical protein
MEAVDQADGELVISGKHLGATAVLYTEQATVVLGTELKYAPELRHDL